MNKIISFVGKKGQGMSLASTAFAMRNYYAKEGGNNKMPEKKKPKVDKGGAYALGQAYGEDARLKLIALIKKLFGRK